MLLMTTAFALLTALAFNTPPEYQVLPHSPSLSHRLCRRTVPPPTAYPSPRGGLSLLSSARQLPEQVHRHPLAYHHPPRPRWGGGSLLHHCPTGLPPSLSPLTLAGGVGLWPALGNFHDRLRDLHPRHTGPASAPSLPSPLPSLLQFVLYSGNRIPSPAAAGAKQVKESKKEK
jgi:hypothetical protein